MILWSGDGLFVVAKVPGIPVFPLHDGSGGDSVLERLLDAHPEQADQGWPPGFDGGIAHRLDNSTSGQLLVARDPRSLDALRGRFQRRELRKRYRFVTARDVPWDEHGVDTPIAHDRRRRGRMVVQRGRATPHRGRWLEASTRFRRVGAVGRGLWLWEAEMRSGVMHQIRLHAASVGLALAGDLRYGGGSLGLSRPEGVEFLLHHLGLSGPRLSPDPVPVPEWWPSR